MNPSAAIWVVQDRRQLPALDLEPPDLTGRVGEVITKLAVNFGRACVLDTLGFSEQAGGLPLKIRTQGLEICRRISIHHNIT